MRENVKGKPTDHVLRRTRGIVQLPSILKKTEEQDNGQSQTRRPSHTI